MAVTKILAIRDDGKKSVVYKTFGKLISALHSNEKGVKNAIRTGEAIQDIKTGEKWYLDEYLEPELETVFMQKESLPMLNSGAKEQIASDVWGLYSIKYANIPEALYFLETEAESFLLDGAGMCIRGVKNSPEGMTYLARIKIER